MNIFNLPDLGEGLPDAEIHEWFVKEGDTVVADQPLVAMETAKAVVDVPCPQGGTIAKLYGSPGDLVKTGDALVAFATDKPKSTDKGTVVGRLEESADCSEDSFTIGSKSQRIHIKATPMVKLLAKKLHVDLHAVKPTGEHDVITQEDVKAHADKNTVLPAGFEPLKGVRRAMLHSMTHSHAEVVPVSIFDEVDIHSWSEGVDITARLIKAIIDACKKEPALNAWVNTAHAARQCFDEIHLGIAMDNEEGLFVPVIHNAASYNTAQLRAIINEFKQSVHDRTISTDKLKGATITLSNFGKFAGRFASPIIVPPMVCIIAVGRVYKTAVINNNGFVESHNMLPLSLSFDHRAVTGGEATRFLGAMINSLQKDE